jgi:hypothetical protein
MDSAPDPLLLRKCGSAGNRTRDLCVIRGVDGPMTCDCNIASSHRLAAGFLSHKRVPVLLCCRISPTFGLGWQTSKHAGISARLTARRHVTAMTRPPAEWPLTVWAIMAFQSTSAPESVQRLTGRVMSCVTWQSAGTAVGVASVCSVSLWTGCATKRKVAEWKTVSKSYRFVLVVYFN